MIKRIEAVWTTSPMSILFVTLLGIVGLSAIVFLVSLLWSTLDDADYWLKAFSIGLTGLLFIVGSATVFTGHYANERSRAEQKKIQLELDQQRERAANAEIALLELYKSLQSRKLTNKFASYLKDNLKGKQPQVSVIVLHRPGENEPRDLAEGIVNTLLGVGWRTVSPNARPFKDEEAAVILIHVPFRVSVGDAPGVVIVARAPNPNPEMSAALNALKRAFQEDDIQVRVEILPNVQALFPKGTDGANMIVIIVGQQIIELKPPQITITEDKQ